MKVIRWESISTTESKIPKILQQDRNFLTRFITEEVTVKTKGIYKTVI